MNNAKQLVEEMASIAGIKINGNKDWDIKVNDERFYKRLLAEGEIGLGELYMDGWWDCKALDECISRILSAKLDAKMMRFSNVLTVLKARLFNLQSKSRSHRAAKHHYDIGNDLYVNMLDKRMIYTCGYWKNAKNLDEAQEAKLELICKKIELKEGMKVLDIGCGWGGFLKYAAEKYKVRGVGITLSKEQIKLAREMCKGLPIEIRFQDYRDVSEQFDRIITVGMFEHVGLKNHRGFMKVVHRCLKPEGIYLLQTVGANTSKNAIDEFTNKYIFPNAVVPSAAHIAKATEGLLVMEDWHNFGIDYYKTLRAWYVNFSKNWDKIKDNYDERFFRMWRYYLLGIAGSFKARRDQLWQVVFSKEGVKGGYNSIR